jgi:hypothetical protein
VGSSVLHGSESLCKLLRYLARHALDHPGSPIKEYQIATEVFGRSADFDPQVDSMVRVQAGRLRTKLGEYYSTLGAEDPVAVDLPKGSYVLAFHQRTPQPGSQSGREVPYMAVPDDLSTQRTLRSLTVATISLSVLLAASIFAMIGLSSGRKGVPPTTVQANTEVAPASIKRFWEGFFSSSEEPWVVFSDAAFVGRPETGMRYFNPAQDSPAHILDHYTGVGEVFAVRNLDHTLGVLKRNIRVKRGSMFTLDDAKNNDLIFVGSPAENLTLRDIPSTHEFVFQRVPGGARKGDLSVFNVHPGPDEPAAFLPSPVTPPLTDDYSVIALVHGLNPVKSTLILAGTTTIGTQAAVEFVCQKDSLEELLRRLSVANSGELKPFEAVIHVKVIRGVPVQTELVALRKGSA